MKNFARGSFQHLQVDARLRLDVSQNDTTLKPHIKSFEEEKIFSWVSVLKKYLLKYFCVCPEGSLNF